MASKVKRGDWVAVKVDSTSTAINGRSWTRAYYDVWRAVCVSRDGRVTHVSSGISYPFAKANKGSELGYQFVTKLWTLGPYGKADLSSLASGSWNGFESFKAAIEFVGKGWEYVQTS